MNNEMFKRDLLTKMESLETLTINMGNFIGNKITDVKTQLNNHLRHHEEMEKLNSMKWFKVWMIVFQVLLTAFLGRMLWKV